MMAWAKVKVAACALAAAVVAGGTLAIGAGGQGGAGTAAPATAPVAVSAAVSKTISGDAAAMQVVGQLMALAEDASPVSGSFVYELVWDKAALEKAVVVVDHGNGKTTVHKNPNPGPERRFRKLEWAWQPDAWRMTRSETDKDGNELSPTFVAAWNGKQGVVLQAKSSIATKYDNEKRIRRDYLERDPRGFSLFYSGMVANMQREGGKVAVRYEDQDGKRLAVLTQDSQYLVRDYWLDPAERMVPRRIVTYSKADKGQLSSDTQITSYVKRPDSAWFVTKSTTVFPIDKLVVNFTAERVAFQPLSKDVFEVPLPAGTATEWAR